MSGNNICAVWLLICTKIIPSIYDLYLLNTYGFCVFPETKQLNFDFTKCEMLVPEGQKHIPSYLSCSSPTSTGVPTYLCSSPG